MREHLRSLSDKLRSRLTGHPRSDARSTEATHELQTSAAHGEITDEVPEQGGELEDGGDESEDEGFQLDGRGALVKLAMAENQTDGRGTMRNRPGMAGVVLKIGLKVWKPKSR